jgi:hypothetical protein
VLKRYKKIHFTATPALTNANIGGEQSVAL